jgi:hypothetical protein
MSTMATTMTVKERELLTKIKAAVALLHGQPSTTPKPAFPSCQSHRTSRANLRGIPIRLKPRRRKRPDGKPRRSVFTELTPCVPLLLVTGGHPYFLKLF